MTTSKLSREGTTETIVQNGEEVVVYVVEVYNISGLDQSAAALSDEEIKAQGRAADGDPVPDADAVRSNITSPRFRVFRHLRSRHQAKVRVTWGLRYFSGGGAVAVNGQRSFSRDQITLQPYLQSQVVDLDGSPVSVVTLEARRVDRLVTYTMFRRLLTTQTPVPVVAQTVEANRRKYYTFNGVPMILERHEIVPANQTQLYVDTWFYSKSALPGVAQRSVGDTTIFAVDAMPTLGEYEPPIPNEESRTSVILPEDLYEPGELLPWL